MQKYQHKNIFNNFTVEEKTFSINILTYMKMISLRQVHEDK